MTLTDIIILLVIAIIVISAATYIIRQKKKGVKCIGCSSGGGCSGKQSAENEGSGCGGCSEK